MHNWFGIQNSNSRAKTILLIKPGGKRAAFIPKSICTKANATVWIWTRHVNPTFRVANYCTTSTTIWDDKDSSLNFLFIQFIWNNSHQLSFFQWSFKNKKKRKKKKTFTPTWNSWRLYEKGEKVFEGHFRSSFKNSCKSLLINYILKIMLT